MASSSRTKEELIQICIELFRKQGYYRTTMSDLAKASNMTKGAFYHHFSSKAEIMLTALKALNHLFQSKVFDISYDKSKPEKERLEILISHAYKFFTNGLGGCFFANTVLETAHVEDTFLEEINTFFTNWENALIEIFKVKFDLEQAKEVAQQIIADIEGSLILTQLYKTDIHLKNALKRGKLLFDS